MATASQNFSTCVSQLIDGLLVPIVNYLKTEHKCEVSVEQLRSVLDVPQPARALGGAVGGSSLVGPHGAGAAPSFLTRGATAPAAAAKTKAAGAKGGSRGKPAVATDPNAPTCIYEYQRGDRKGQKCGMPCFEGLQYCRSCKDKATVMKQIKTDSGPAAAATGKAGAKASAEIAAPTVKVLAVPSRGEGIYKEQNYGFIIQQYSDGTAVALCVEDNGRDRDLTEAEKKVAESMCIGVLDTNEGDEDEDEDVDEAEDSAVVPVGQTAPAPSAIKSFVPANLKIGPVPAGVPSLPGLKPGGTAFPSLINMNRPKPAV